MDWQTDTQKLSFDTLLSWLDEDPEKAGLKYEQIRKGLMYSFLKRGCSSPEELADETFDRVTKNISSLVEKYEGEPTAYFYAVARNVFLEYTRRPKSVELSPFTTAEKSQPAISDEDYECFTNCLNELPAGHKEFVVSYYQFDKRTKINHRLEMSEKMGVSPEHLRVKAFRIRRHLQKCFQLCREQSL